MEDAATRFACMDAVGAGVRRFEFGSCRRRRLDLEIGGAGSGPRTILELRDLAFDAANNVYVLDGLRYDHGKKEFRGNGRVQKFDAQGKFLSQFSVRDASLG
jgi:DNA-binding beta-propeller fold protein YncE